MAWEGRGGINNSAPKVGTRVVQQGRPKGGGWIWLGQNKAGENVWAYKPGGRDAKGPQPPSGGVSHSIQM